MRSTVQYTEILKEKKQEFKTLEEEIKELNTENRENDGRFRSLFQFIRLTIDKMLNEDMTLGNKVQTLFRENGITIVSIITALDMTTGVIVEGILSATKYVVKPTPSPKPKPDPKPPKPKPDPNLKNQNQDG